MQKLFELKVAAAQSGNKNERFCFQPCALTGRITETLMLNCSRLTLTVERT